MSNVKISNLPQGTANINAVVPADNADGTATEKIKLQDISKLSLGDVSFSGVQVIGAGSGSGDGSNKGTLELVPDSTLRNNDQYLIVDPAGPDHIHLRAGGEQDGSNAELFLGGEHAHVSITDSEHQVNITSSFGGTMSVSFGVSCANSHLSSFFLPTGTTFTENNTLYTVTSCPLDTECQQGYLVFLSPEAISEFGGPLFGNTTVTATLPYADQNWTFGNDGVLDLASGGLRFSDNTVQTEASPSRTGSGSNSVVIGGQNNTASGNYSAVIGGQDGIASLTGEISHSSGMFAAQGDAQHRIFMMRGISAYNQTISLTLNGQAGQYLIIPENAVWNFSIKLVAKNTKDINTNVGAAAFNIIGIVENRNGGAYITAKETTRMSYLGVEEENPPYSDLADSNFNCNVSIGTYSGSSFLDIACICDNAPNLLDLDTYWVASVDVVQLIVSESLGMMSSPSISTQSNSLNNLIP